MSNIIYPVETRNARLQLNVTNAGADAQILLVNGTRPLNGGALTGGNTILAELVAGATFATVTGGVLTANAITRDNEGNADGTPTFARILTSADGWVADIDLSGFPAIVTGQPVEISALTITDANYDA